MTLEPGTTLLHYRLVERVGAGGMGVVWRAEDGRLGRDLAVKILPPEVAGDPDRLARFEREARSLAALSHPNVAQVHGIETDPSGIRFLALEWVPGEDLAERVARGPVPPDEAIAIGRQIATGLAAAHERGIVHRDLKPANVRVTPDGGVKLLDFGLAKIVASAAHAEDPEGSPTITSHGTQIGTVLGTAAYMSPEQARGRPVDRRTDVWAFGCVLFEMLTGRSPFRGDTVTDTLASILEREPDLGAVPATTPRSVVRLIRRCLRKDPAHRLRDLGDALLELDDEDREAPATSAARPVGGRRRTVAWVVAIVAVAALTWYVARRDNRDDAGGGPRSSSLSIVLPEGSALDMAELPPLAISPDGRWIAYVARDDAGSRLYLRPVDEFEAREVPDSDGALSPFFSPDGDRVGFQRGIELLQASVSGSAPARVGGVPPIARGFDWWRDDEIAVTWSKRAGLFGLSVDDGTVRAITTVVPGDDEVVHNWAQGLPGGGVLATVVGADATSYEDGRIVVFDPDRGSRTTIVEGGYFGRLLPDDVLVFARGGTLYATRVDRDTWARSGPTVPVLDGFLTDPNTGSTWIDVAGDGTLVYVPGGIHHWQTGHLVWVDRAGSIEPLLDQSRPYRFPRISPDGSRALFMIETVHDDVWMLEFDRGSMTRLTFDRRNMVPIWRPDSDEITYSAVGGDVPTPSLFSVRTDVRAEPVRLLADHDGTSFCTSWSPDGSTLAFVDWTDAQQFDIWLSGDGGTAGPVPFLDSRFDEHSAMFSPDGRWIAYVSDESGSFEVYVAPADDDGRRYQVSPNGGFAPVWNPQGGELFYREGSRLMVAPVRTAPELTLGEPRALFDMPDSVGRLYWVTQYDVSPDGRRFLTVAEDPAPEPREIRVVRGWLDAVESKLDAR